MDYEKNYARTGILKFSFFNRIVDMWNALPLSSRCAPSIFCFKKQIADFLATRLSLEYFGRYLYVNRSFYFFDIKSGLGVLSPPCKCPFTQKRRNSSVPYHKTNNPLEVKFCPIICFKLF